MNKKIGILTFQDTTNFGSALQTFGLWYAVHNLGYDVEIIDYICERIHYKEVSSFKKNCLSLKKIIVYLIYNKPKYKNIYKFLYQNSKISEKKYNLQNISVTNELYDLFLVGSDIIWSPSLTYDYTYFLDFVNDDKKKFAFASSVGNKLKEEEKIKVKELINKFQKIAVREIQSKQWLEELCNKKIDIVCDPTMLLTKEEWLRFVGKRIIKRKYVLVYFNDDNNNCLTAAVEYAKKNNLEVYYINYGRRKANTKNISPLTIEEFLSLIFYSEHTFTASYHGLLFSVYFNKPFIYFKRNPVSRMESLAEILEIQNQDGENIDIAKYNPEINWLKINNNVDKFRKKSINKLKEIVGE